MNYSLGLVQNCSAPTGYQYGNGYSTLGFQSQYVGSQFNTLGLGSQYGNLVGTQYGSYAPQHQVLGLNFGQRWF